MTARVRKGLIRRTMLRRDEIPGSPTLHYKCIVEPRWPFQGHMSSANALLSRGYVRQVRSTSACDVMSVCLNG